MSCSRSRGRLRRQRRSSLSIAGGHAAGSRSQAGSSLMTEAMISEAVSPLKSARPVSISKRTTPNDQMSARSSTARPPACSGDM
jgi:hypothetical protein